jgi:heptosyltransferase-1
VKRILIVKLSSLGDLFHALPAAHLIKSATGAEIDWACHDIYVDLVRRFEPVAEVIGFPRHSFARDGRAFLRALRAREYEMALDLQGLLKSAFVSRAARAARRIGPSFSREGARIFYDAVSGPTNKNRHAVEECLDTVRYLGLPDAPVEFPVHVEPYALDLPRPIVGLLPCSRRAEKNWPPERFVETGRALRSSGATLLLLGGPADRDVCARIASAIGEGAHDWSGRTSMTELVDLIGALDALVTVDSGPMHIAAAVGTPLVAIFGPTDPTRTGPYGRDHKVICADGDLAALAAAPVIAAAEALLRG